MEITQVSFGVFESKMDEDELDEMHRQGTLDCVDEDGKRWAVATDNGGPSGELLHYLWSKGLMKPKERVTIEYLARGHFRVSLLDLVDAFEAERSRVERTNRPARVKTKRSIPAFTLPDPITVDISCSLCDHDRSVIVDGVSYCKRHAREAGLGPHGKIT